MTDNMASLPNLPLSIPFDLDIQRQEEIAEKGGKGSGNFGHAGLAGVHGGSSPTKTGTKVQIPTLNSYGKGTAKNIEQNSVLFEDKGNETWASFSRSLYGLRNHVSYWVSPEGNILGEQGGWLNTHTAVMVSRIYRSPQDYEQSVVDDVYDAMQDEVGWGVVENDNIEKHFEDRGWIRVGVTRDNVDRPFEKFTIRTKMPAGAKAIRFFKNLYDSNKIPGLISEVYINGQSFHVDEVLSGKYLVDMKTNNPDLPFTIKGERTEKGGKGSGHHGHTGLAGVHGGSSSTRVAEYQGVSVMSYKLKVQERRDYSGETYPSLIATSGDQADVEVVARLSEELPFDINDVVDEIVVVGKGEAVDKRHGAQNLLVVHRVSEVFYPEKSSTTQGVFEPDKKRLYIVSEKTDSKKFGDITKYGFRRSLGYAVAYKYGDLFSSWEKKRSENPHYAHVPSLGWGHRASPKDAFSMFFANYLAHKANDRFATGYNPAFYVESPAVADMDNFFNKSTKEHWTEKGGRGSGNWGHGGLPGVHGGSSPTKTTGGIPSIDTSGMKGKNYVDNMLEFAYGDSKKPNIADRLPKDFKGERFIVDPKGRVIYPRPDDSLVASHTQVYAYLAFSGYETFDKNIMEMAEESFLSGEVENEALEKVFFDRGYFSIKFFDRENRVGSFDRSVILKTGLKPSREALTAIKTLNKIGIKESSPYRMGDVGVYFADRSTILLPFEDIPYLRGFRKTGTDYAGVTIFEPVLKEVEIAFKGYMKAIVIGKLIEWQEKGGRGSGNWGHGGLAGVHGGSSARSGYSGKLLSPGEIKGELDRHHEARRNRIAVTDEEDTASAFISASLNYGDKIGSSVYGVYEGDKLVAAIGYRITDVKGERLLYVHTIGSVDRGAGLLCLDHVFSEAVKNKVPVQALSLHAKRITESLGKRFGIKTYEDVSAGDNVHVPAESVLEISRLIKRFLKMGETTKGGRGSGHWGHGGLAGVHGGSTSKRESPLDLPYGGIPSVGGYDNWSEYEVGHQIFCEAAHCILGSLRKMKKGNPKEAEAGHITEELGLMRKAIAEYSRDIYTRDLESDRLPEIEKAGKGLLRIARDMRDGLGKPADEVERLALSTYNILHVFAFESRMNAMVGKRNVFKNRRLKDHFTDYEKEVEKFLSDSALKGHIKSIVSNKLTEWQEKGGKGSGNWGHGGLTGVHGGSSSGGNMPRMTGWEWAIDSINREFLEKGKEQEAVDELLGAFYGSPKKPLISDELKREAVFEKFIVTPSGKFVYASMDRTGYAGKFTTHTMMYAYMAVSGFEKDLPEGHGDIAKKALFTLESERTEIPFLEKGYLSVNTVPYTSGKNVMIQVKSAGTPNKKTVRAIKKLVDDVQRVLPVGRNVSGVYVEWIDRTAARQHFTVDEIDLLEGISIRGLSVTPIYKEISEKGGKGSGNWGHQGLPVVHGGSSTKRLGSTVSESNKHWQGTKADGIRRQLLEKAETKNELVDRWRRESNLLHNQLFDQVADGRVDTALFDKARSSQRNLILDCRKDFATLTEIIGDREEVNVRLDIWETYHPTAPEKDKDWLRKHFGEKFNETIGEFSKIIPQSFDGSVIEVKLEIGRNETRYEPNKKRIVVDPSSPTYSTSDLVHELSHWMEHVNGWYSKASAFRDRRTVGETPRPIAGVVGNSFVVDKFFSPYAGRIYPGVSKRFTEITSVGMARLYEDPVGFARQDPDYFNFVIDLLIGG